MDQYLHKLVNCQYFLVPVPEQGAVVAVEVKAETDLHSEGEASELVLQNQDEFDQCPRSYYNLFKLDQKWC